MNRVVRGGCWSNSAAALRAWDRDINTPSYRIFKLGLRLAMITT